MTTCNLRYSKKHHRVCAFFYAVLGYKFVDMFLSVIVTMIRYTITKFVGKIAVAQRGITITVCWVEKDVQRDKILEAVLGYVKIS